MTNLKSNVYCLFDVSQGSILGTSLFSVLDVSPFRNMRLQSVYMQMILSYTWQKNFSVLRILWKLVILRCWIWRSVIGCFLLECTLGVVVDVSPPVLCPHTLLVALTFIIEANIFQLSCSSFVLLIQFHIDPKWVINSLWQTWLIKHKHNSSHFTTLFCSFSSLSHMNKISDSELNSCDCN